MRIGIVGLGVMGRVHFKIWASRDDAKVVAVCDVDPDAFAGIAKEGNLQQQSGAVDLGDVSAYNDFETMLSEAELDAVSIALPTHLHADYSVMALERGWHVLCEKPMALNAKDCNRMIAAAGTGGKVLMVAQCIRFWPEYAWCRKTIEAGTCGALLAAHFHRLGSAPGWGKGSWYSDPAKSGGVTLDLHIHDVDYIQHLLGMPRGLCASGAPLANGMLGHIVTDLDYGEDKVITAEASWMMSKTFGFTMGFRMVLDTATLVFDSARKPAFRVFPDTGEAFTPELPSGDGYRWEIAHFSDLIKGTAEPLITPEQARDSVEIALKAARAAETAKEQGQ